jgi:hypothetical protein
MPQGTYTATVGSETTVFETDVTTPATFYAEIGLGNLQTDEAITFYLYKKVDGANYLLADSVLVKNPLLKVLRVEESYIGPSHGQLKVTAKQWNGTARIFPWIWNARS